MSQYSAKLGKNGRLTIPKAIRTHLGLSSKDLVEFVCQPGKIYVRRVHTDNKVSARTTRLLEKRRGGQNNIHD
jgi:AbrB family looped-hinge helix DNA binding protein